MPQLTMPGTRGRNRRGFTLTELMIVVVVLGILMAILSTMFLTQQRFYGDVGETAAIRRELRTGAGILPLDIRGISGPGGDIISYNTTKIEVRAPIGSAVICDIAADRASFEIFPSDLEANTLSSFWTDPLPSDVIFVFDDSTSAGAEDDEWREHTIGGVASSSGCDVGSTPFTSLAADAAASKPRTRITLAGGETIGSTVQVGAVVRFTRRMEYRLFQPSGASNYYIGMREFRNGSWGSMTPVSGPYVHGPSFAFFDTLGGPVTGGSAADLARIARVDLTLNAEGAEARSFGRNGPIRDSLFLSIGIRNFR
jgi:prepilin-type N-terminal cleavage/methylation domain-containing protein